VTRPGIRQAMLKPAYSHLYPGIAANEWQPAAVMMDLVLALKPRKLDHGAAPRDRALNDAHFEFRGVASSGSADAVRQARQDERRRREAE
jgi:hypothetical protein